MNERVTFSTDDGVTIVGDYYEGGGSHAALLLHMMPATRASWTAFANTLVDIGVSALAIDLRGHGESTAGPNGTMLDYRDFEDRDHQASIQDVAAAVEFLRREKKMKQIDLVGASIGANLAFSYAAAHHDIRSLILLSPGIEFHGISTESVAAKFAADQRAFFLASTEDEYSAASAKELYGMFPGEKKLELFHDAGHGTTMLERKPGYLALLTEWLLSR